MVTRSVYLVQVRVLLVVTFLAGPSSELTRCITDDDCPTNGGCFKDECARCLCREGHHVVNFYDGDKLHHICEQLPPVAPRVGGRCSDDKWRARPCPRGSHCDVTTGRCLCDRNLVSHSDNTHCRLAVYGEQCSDEFPCAEDLGFRCKSGLCRCLVSFHRPTSWTRFVLRRWDYSKVVGNKQSCVARAVGEKCRRDEHCAAVQGSGAVCRQCGLCRCRVSGHVPDILGTTCGPPLGVGEACSVHAEHVCDGARGLQCGDVCNLYDLYSVTTKTCTCSQMHDRHRGECVPKKVGSSCSTDLDCYLLTNGFGYCDDGWCRADAFVTRYTPHQVNITCREWKEMQATPGRENKHDTSTLIPKTNVPSFSYVTNSSLVDFRKSSSVTLTPRIEPELAIAAGSTPAFLERNKPDERSITSDISSNVAGRERDSLTSGVAIPRRDIPLAVSVLLFATVVGVSTLL